MSENLEAYLHPTYAGSFAEFGTPQRLPRSGAWILTREIPGHAGLRDAMAIYPFLCCDWAELPADLEELTDLVSITAVPDPFGDYDLDLLKTAFPDCLNENYKIAEIADLDLPYDDFCSSSRRKAAIKALDKLTIEVVADPQNHLDEWNRMYGELIAKHKIVGLRAFSTSVFEGLLSTPGLVYIRARYEGQTVGVHTWMVQGDVAYAHLAAYDTSLGYKLYAPSVLYWFALGHFSGNVRWLFYGGSAAGANESNQDKLINFKKSWGSDVRPVYLCGRILQPDNYAMLSEEKLKTSGGYFPAYRHGEF
jgi:hypothetical protein